MHLVSLLIVVTILIHDAKEALGSDLRSSIVGGQDAREGAWPWMAHLNISNGSYRWRCGGSLLSNQWVLTSARCVDPNRHINFRKSMIWLGTQNLHGPSAFYRGISSAVLHPNYEAKSGGFLNNIALVKMSKTVTMSDRVQPVLLPTPDEAFDASSECWITGWGYTGNGDYSRNFWRSAIFFPVPLSGKETLQQLKIPILPRSNCERAYPSLTAHTLCAGDKNGGKDACLGDYGGPLVCATPRGFVQAGISSFGNSQGCGLPDFPGVYTLVSHYHHFIDYIHHNLEGLRQM